MSETAPEQNTQADADNSAAPASSDPTTSTADSGTADAGTDSAAPSNDDGAPTATNAPDSDNPTTSADGAAPADAETGPEAAAQGGVTSEQYREEHNIAGEGEGEGQSQEDLSGVNGTDAHTLSSEQHLNPDGNPAFHGDQPAVDQFDGADLPVAEAYEEGTNTNVV